MCGCNWPHDKCHWAPCLILMIYMCYTRLSAPARTRTIRLDAPFGWRCWPAEIKTVRVTGEEGMKQWREENEPRASTPNFHCPPGAIVDSLSLFYSGLTTTWWIQGLLVVVNGGKLRLAVAMHPGQSHASRHWLNQSMDTKVYPSCPSRWGHCLSLVILSWVAFITLLPQVTNPLTHLHMSGCKLFRSHSISRV